MSTLHQGQGQSLELDLSMEGQSRLALQKQQKNHGARYQQWDCCLAGYGQERSVLGEKMTFTHLNSKCSEIPIRRGTNRDVVWGQGSRVTAPLLAPVS